MKKLLLIVASILLGSATLAGAASVFQTFQGGSGTSTPSGILYGDNGLTTHLNTVTIGTGLTFSGGTLSSTALTTAITDLGAGGATTTGPKVTLSTTTSTTNGRTDALTIVVSGTQINFTPSQSGTLSVAGGGTGAATLTGCLTGNGTGAITGSGTCNTSAASVTSVTLATPNSTLSLGGTNPVTTSGTINADLNLAHSNIWTVLQSFSNASTTQLSAGLAYFGTTATSTFSSIGSLTMPIGSLLTAPSASTTNLSVNNKTVIGDRYLTFSIATTTAWTSSTTLLELGPAPFGMTWNSVQCHTSAGTLNVQFEYGSGPTFALPMIAGASTTVGTVTFTSANTPAKGNPMYVVVGTPASSPLSASCTLDATITSL